MASSPSRRAASANSAISSMYRASFGRHVEGGQGGGVDRGRRLAGADTTRIDTHRELFHESKTGFEVRGVKRIGIREQRELAGCSERLEQLFRENWLGVQGAVPGFAEARQSRWLCAGAGDKCSCHCCGVMRPSCQSCQRGSFSIDDQTCCGESFSAAAPPLPVGRKLPAARASAAG